MRTIRRFLDMLSLDLAIPIAGLRWSLLRVSPAAASRIALLCGFTGLTLLPLVFAPQCLGLELMPVALDLLEPENMVVSISPTRGQVRGIRRKGKRGKGKG